MILGRLRHSFPNEIPTPDPTTPSHCRRSILQTLSNGNEWEDPKLTVSNPIRNQPSRPLAERYLLERPRFFDMHHLEPDSLPIRIELRNGVVSLSSVSDSAKGNIFVGTPKGGTIYRAGTGSRLP